MSNIKIPTIEDMIGVILEDYKQNLSNDPFNDNLGISEHHFDRVTNEIANLFKNTNHYQLKLINDE